MTAFPCGADAVAFRPGGDGEFVIGLSNLYGELWSGALLICAIEDDAFVVRRNIETYTGVAGCVWAGDAQANLVVSAHDDGGLHVWDHMTEEQTHTASLVGHTDAVLCVAACPDDCKQLVSAGVEPAVKVWDVTQPEAPLMSLSETNMAKTCALAWGTGGAVASGSADGVVKLWDVRERCCTRSIEIASGDVEVSALSWSRSGNHLAVGSECSEVHVFDVRAPDTPLSMWNKHGASITSVSFSPHHDTMLASGSHDTTAVVGVDGDGSSFKTVATHKDTVTDIAWHPTVPGILVSVGWDSQAVASKFEV